MTDPKKKKNDPKKTNPQEEAEADPWDVLMDQVLRNAWHPALRMALDSHGAPGRCNRRACRMAGACCMTVKEGEPLDCGGGLTDEALKTVAVAALFGCLLVRSCVEDVVVPEKRLAMAAAAVTVPRRGNLH